MKLIKNVYHKYIDIQYTILLKLIIFLFPKTSTPEKANEKLEKIKSGSVFLMKKIVIYSFVLIQCYIIGIIIFYVLYYFMIPYVDQTVNLNFSKEKGIGYIAPFVNQYKGNSLCSFNKLESNEINFDETLKLTKKQICSNSFNSGYDDIILEREFYEIKFLLTLTDLQENYNIGSFAVNAFFINKQGEIFKFSKIASMHHEVKESAIREKIYSFLKYFGLMDTKKNLIVSFFDTIPNHIIDIQAIIVHIPEYSLILYDGKLNFQAKLYGIRYYMNYWFWTCLFLVTNIIAWGFFLTFVIITVILRLLPSPTDLILKKLL